MEKIIYNYGIYFLWSVISQFFDILSKIFTSLVEIAMVLVLLLFENMTNTNTILAVGIVFQYNTSRIVHPQPPIDMRGNIPVHVSGEGG